VFDVLAEPHRRRILDLLRTEARTVGDLVAELHLSQPGVSKHLRVLRDAGLVAVRVDAQRRVYRLQAEPLREIDDWLAPYRAEWRDRLDTLERHLDEMPD
jgi:DNA-binding transcriptional ArsR family regulator